MFKISFFLSYQVVPNPPWHDSGAAVKHHVILKGLPLLTPGLQRNWTSQISNDVSKNKANESRVATNSDFDRISNTEYYSFLGIYKYRIPNNIRSWKLTNTEYRILFGQGKFTNTEYRIVLFGLNYSNTELFEHWNGPAYSNFRKECVNLARMIKVIVNNVSAIKIINIFSHFLSQNVTLQGVF